MPRGGKREGAGRKVASLTKRTRAIADRAAELGITPLEVMVENMRFAHEGADKALAKIMGADIGADPAAAIDAMKNLLGLRKMSQECARDAAPYVHPRLAAVEHTGKDGGPMVVEVVRFTDAEDKATP